MKSRRRLVLLQVRDRPDAEHQERMCFLDRLAVDTSQLHAINLVQRPVLEWRHVCDADAILIGGAGAHSVTRHHSFTGPLIDIVRRWSDEGRPIFGSCWGHQFLAEALGGSVVTDTTSEEVGTFDVELTPAGQADPLFGELPKTFAVQLGHKDRIERLPEGAVCLARSERCEVQAMRMADKPIYGTQFHPEMTVDHIRARLHMYGDVYLGADAQRVEARLRSSLEADRLLRRFVELYC